MGRLHVATNGTVPFIGTMYKLTELCSPLRPSSEGLFLIIKDKYCYGMVYIFTHLANNILGHITHE